MLSGCSCQTCATGKHLTLPSSSWQVVTVCVAKHVVNGVSAVQVLADQPFSASRRRQLLLNFLQAKLEAEDEQLLLEGARVSTAAQQQLGILSYSAIQQQNDVREVQAKQQ